jgi:hypothetical protein
MGHPLRKKVWMASLLLLIATAGLYFLRRETYFLNKNVRLVSLRLFTFQELSLHRSCRYKMQFHKDHYSFFIFAPSQETEWKEVAAFRYENSIETSMPGFALKIDRGLIVSYDWPEGGKILRSNFVLSFFAGKAASKQRGILFSKDRTWRAL